jgi:hypothetical protein
MNKEQPAKEGNPNVKIQISNPNRSLPDEIGYR